MDACIKNKSSKTNSLIYKELLVTPTVLDNGQITSLAVSAQHASFSLGYNIYIPKCRSRARMAEDERNITIMLTSVEGLSSTAMTGSTIQANSLNPCSFTGAVLTCPRKLYHLLRESS